MQHQNDAEWELDVARTCHDFLQALKRKQRTAIEDWIPSASPLKDQLILELVCIEMEQRIQNGENTTSSEYFKRFPQLAEDPVSSVRVTKLEDRLKHEILTGQSTFNSNEPEGTLVFVTPSPAPDNKTCLEDNLRTRAVHSGPVVDRFARESIDRVGEYELLSEIAHGGMGVVYKARHSRLGRIVALKLIKSGELASEEEIIRFDSEARTAATLDHPNIVPVFEAGQHQGQRYIAMAYVDGPSLWSKAKEAPIESRAAAAMLEQICHAIQYAHEMGIIHRDIKPHNILQSSDGTVRITDFGLAKQSHANSGLTVSGALMGTPSYMSPEQASGKNEQIGVASDVYGLGATLYALICGRAPFQSANPVSTLKQVLEDEPIPPRTLNPSIPKDLETICCKAIQKDPSRRYLSAREFADDLRRLQLNEPVLARPVSRWEYAWRWSQRNRALALSLLGIFILLTVGTTVSTSLAIWANAQKIKAVNATKGMEIEAKRALDASILAEQNENKAKLQADLAVANAQAKSSLLADMYTSNGVRESQAGKSALATLWFANSATTALADSHRVDCNLTRCKLWSMPLLQPARALLHTYETDPTNKYSRKWSGTISEFAPQPYGTHLLSRSASTQDWALWDVTNGRRVFVLPESEQVSAACWSNKGERLAVASRTGGVWLVDAVTKQQKLILKTGPAVSVLQWSLDGRWLAITTENRLRIWDVEREQFALGEAELIQTIRWIKWSDSSTSIAIMDDNGLLIVCDLREETSERSILEQRKVLFRTTPVPYTVHTFEAQCPIAPIWLNGDKWLLGVTAKNTVTVWDVSSGEQVRTLDPALFFIDSTVRSPDGKWVALCGWSGCRLLSVPDLRLGAPITHSNSQPICAAFSADGSKLVTGSNDYTVRLWSVPQLKPLCEFANLTNEVRAVCFVGNMPTAGQRGGLIALFNQGQATYTEYKLKVSRTTAPHYNYDTHVSQEGRYCLTNDTQGNVSVFDMQERRIVGNIPTTFPLSYQGAFVPNSSIVVIQGNQRITAFDWKTENVQWGPIAIPYAGQTIAACPTGKKLVSLGITSGSILDASTGEMLTQFVDAMPGDSVNGRPYIQCSPNGEYFVTYGSWGTQLWRTDGTGTSRIISAEGAPSIVASFSNDGETLITGAQDNFARIFNTSSGVEVASLQNSSWVYAASFSHDQSKVLTTTNKSGDARVWDWKRQLVLYPPVTHDEAEIFSGAWLPGDQSYVTYANGSLRFWDAETGLELAPPITTFAGKQQLRVARDAHALVNFATSGAAHVIDLHPLVGDGGHEYSAQLWQKRAELLAARKVGENGGIERISMAEWIERFESLPTSELDIPPSPALVTEEVKARLAKGSVADSPTSPVVEVSPVANVKLHPITQMVRQPDGNLLVAGWTGEPNSSVAVTTVFTLPWDLEKSNKPTELCEGSIVRGLGVGERTSVGNWPGIAGTLDGRLFAASIRNRDVFWKPIARANDHPKNGIYAVAVGPSRKWFALASEGGVEVLDSQLKPLKWLTLDPETSCTVLGLALNPDRTRLAAVSDTGQLTVWETESFTPVATLPVGSTGADGVQYSPDGRLLVTAATDGEICVWDGESYRLRRTLKGHSEAVIGLAFNSRGNLLASTSHDRTVRVWRMTTGEPVWVGYGHEGYVRSVVFSADDQQLISGGWDGQLLLWNPSVASGR